MRTEVLTKRTCQVCSTNIAEIFEIEAVSGANGKIGGSHAFHTEVKSVGYVCDNGNCRIVYAFEPTTDKQRLKDIAFVVLATKDRRNMRSSFDAGNGTVLKDASVVYVVPELEGVSGGVFRRPTHLEVVIEPRSDAPRFRVPVELLDAGTE